MPKACGYLRSGCKEYPRSGYYFSEGKVGRAAVLTGTVFRRSSVKIKTKPVKDIGWKQQKDTERYFFKTYFLTKILKFELVT